MQDYPKWKYAQNSAVVVDSADAEAALTGDWFDSPADVPEVAEKRARKPKEAAE